MSVLNSSLASVIRTISPTPAGERKEFLERAREKVVHYKPRMEEQTKIKFGDVSVKDLAEYEKDMLGLEQKGIFDHPEGRVEKMVSSALAPLARLDDWIKLLFTPTEMKYERTNSTIYVPFHFINRIYHTHVRDKFLSQNVVHELSHHLWFRINPDGEFDDVWSEGFATYCEEVYFQNLYPSSYSLKQDDGGIYKEGREKVQQLVAKYGNSIVLEVPARWREFDKELRK